MVDLSNGFKFFMISAMYENGGNTTQRFFDGHSRLYVYPFESQLGTKKTGDYLASFVPHKYRWPQFALEDNFETDYDSIWDEEVKIRVKIPHMSKFKDVDIHLKDDERRDIFLTLLKNQKRNRRNIVAAFFIATFKAWKNYQASGNERTYVGYNPVAILDGEKILSDFPDAHIIHVVRNPFSAYAETKHRPIPLSLERYINTWNIIQLTALNLENTFPKNIHIVLFEDIIKNPKEAFTNLADKLDIPYEDSFLYPSWNSKKLDNIYPWGTVQYPTTEYNKKKASELSKNEHDLVASLSKTMILHFGYKDF